jgi:hypothetical protein
MLGFAIFMVSLVSKRMEWLTVSGAGSSRCYLRV